MAHTIKLNAQLLKDNAGNFIAEDGHTVNYHNGTFFDLDGNSIFKANFSESSVIPPIAKPSKMVFQVIMGEKFTKLEFVCCE